MAVSSIGPEGSSYPSFIHTKSHMPSSGFPSSSLPFCCCFVLLGFFLSFDKKRGSSQLICMPAISGSECKIDLGLRFRLLLMSADGWFPEPSPLSSLQEEESTPLEEGRPFRRLSCFSQSCNVFQIF